MFYSYPQVTLNYVADVNKPDVKLASQTDAERFCTTLYGEGVVSLYECAFAIYVNRANDVIGVMPLGSGGRAGVIMDIALIAQAALLANAHGVILTHNHPSGQQHPSAADRRVTADVKAALKLFSIELLDHIIVTANGAKAFGHEQ